MPAMLNLWRRHTPKCPHRKKGRAHIKCKCPIWVDGELHGERFRQSTGTRDWRWAIKKLAAWEAAAPEDMKPLSEAVDSFLAHCHHLTPDTFRNYRNVLQYLQDFCTEHGLYRLVDLTVESLDRYRLQRRIAPLTSVKELQILRQFCQFCVDRDWLRRNLAKRITPPKNAKPARVEPYTESEVTRLLAACDAFGRRGYERLRARAMVLLLRFTALRISDVATLERIRIHDDEIALHTLKTGGLVKLPDSRRTAKRVRQLAHSPRCGRRLSVLLLERRHVKPGYGPQRQAFAGSGI